MILFLYGKDTFRSRSHMHKMMAKFKADRDPQGLNVSRLDAMTDEPSKIMNEILAAPFLAEKRMVVVENLILSKHDAFRKDMLTRIEENSLPDTTVIVFWEDGTKYKKKEQKAFFERLLQEKYAQEFAVLEGAKLSGWIASEVTARGAKINRQAVQYLAAHVGSDTWRLHSLVDQLVAYAHRREIVQTDCELFIEEKVDDNIFNLVDNILAKKPRNVFAMLQEQYKGGKDALYVFAMVIRQVRILLILADLEERGESASPKELSLHPFVVKKSTDMARRYGMKALQDVYAELLEMDRNIKLGRGESKLMMDIFAGKLATTK